jgi:hypothetical protein
MSNYELPGQFYLGRPVDPATGTDLAEPLLYDARDLTTHAVCVGMTGSGKTGLCLSLLEEAAIDGVPTIAIDPKGDLGNLLLSFPELRPSDFAPWVDPGEAQRKGITIDELAAKTAETWRNGLASWDQSPERIRRFRDAADIHIYTPGSDSGRPLSVLRSFQAPPPATLADPSALRDQISATVSGLLGMIGIDADPVKSREHILLSSLFAHAWGAQRDLDLPAVIQGVQQPPFDKVGLFDLETFYPAKERIALAMALNNLLASPGFAAWMHGAPLDIERLLFGENGKPRISIISIAHLNDVERMFVVTLVLSEVVTWMRRQSGTSSLRALVYMDEIFGYFPPSAMPPSKQPLLTLMKQARAFGVGVVLATQNPVDLDYKGLSNAGTWFIGRLQTERDKARLLDGLLSAGDGGLDRSTLETLLANLGNRVFLMRNVHEDAPVLFRTRWALSYLRGPLTLQEIARLTPIEENAPTPSPAQLSSLAQAAPGASAARAAAKPLIPHGVAEYFAPTPAAGDVYSASLLAVARLHFVDRKLGIDTWQTRSYTLPLAQAGRLDWSAATTSEGDTRNSLARSGAADVGFREPLPALLHAPNYKQWQKDIEEHLYRDEPLELFACLAAGQTSAPGEDEASFKARLALALREKRDAQIEKLREKYAARLRTLEDQIRRAEERVEREQAQLADRRMQTAVSVGTSILGALLGRKRLSTTTLSKAGTAARNAGRLGREQQDVARAQASREELLRRREELEQEVAAQIEEMKRAWDPQTVAIETVRIAARKTDIDVELAVLWG